jgi:hypothetical protein
MERSRDTRVKEKWVFEDTSNRLFYEGGQFRLDVYQVVEWLSEGTLSAV